MLPMSPVSTVTYVPGTDPELIGWGGRIRTSAWRNQNPLPYHLATPQNAGRSAAGNIAAPPHRINVGPPPEPAVLHIISLAPPRMIDRRPAPSVATALLHK